MLKKAALFLGLALTLKANAFAWVGGPFSNGGFSNLTERSGVYHATFNFKNGSGYAYFTPDNDLAPPQEDNEGTPFTKAPLTVYNRSVLYYKGMVFVGSAMGTSDIDKRRISGFTNGHWQVNHESSDDLIPSYHENTVVANTGRPAYTANLRFEAKIKQTAPQIRFRGKGELAVITPDAANQVAEIVQKILTQGSNSQGSVNSGTGVVVVSAEPAFAANLRVILENKQNLMELFSQVSPDQSQKSTEFTPVRVTGVLRTF